MSRVQREKGVSYSFADSIMGLITQLQQYQSFLKIRLFSRFLYQHSIVEVPVLKLGQSQNIRLTVCGSEEENNNVYFMLICQCIVNKFLKTFQQDDTFLYSILFPVNGSTCFG
jgi:hypothetical protein